MAESQIQWAPVGYKPEKHLMDPSSAAQRRGDAVLSASGQVLTTDIPDKKDGRRRSTAKGDPVSGSRNLGQMGMDEAVRPPEDDTSTAPEVPPPGVARADHLHDHGVH